jgi:hypothetical protein
MKKSTLPILFVVATCGLAGAQEQKAASYPAMAPMEQYRIADVQEEIALARTAAPSSIAEHAEVLVLGDRGYEVAVKGENGFVCFVERSWAADFEDSQFWNPKLRAPNCFNPPAVRSVLPQFLKRTEWVLTSASKQRVIERTRAAFASHEFAAPEAGSISFMMSKQGYLGDEAGGPWLPHVMLFVPHGQPMAWGAELAGSPILGKESSPIEPTVLFIPVARWSDGSPVPHPAEHHH